MNDKLYRYSPQEAINYMIDSAVFAVYGTRQKLPPGQYIKRFPAEMQEAVKHITSEHVSDVRQDQIRAIIIDDWEEKQKLRRYGLGL